MALGWRLTTQLATLRRRQPEATMSNSPTLEAYLSKSRGRDFVAEPTFHAKWQQKEKDFGSLDVRTALSLNNWIITLIKLDRFQEAEEQCKSSLASMNACGLGDSQQYLCMLCNLATCQLLSGGLAAVNSRSGATIDLTNNLTHLTNENSKPDVDQSYIRARGMNTEELSRRQGLPRIKRDSTQNRLGVLIRVPSWMKMRLSHRLDQPGRIATPVLSQEYNFTTPNGDTAKTASFGVVTPPSTLGTSSPELVHPQGNSMIASSHPALAIQTMTNVSESAKVADWLDHQKLHPPLPDIPEATSPLSMNRRSTGTARTARTSQMYDIPLRNLLAITAWGNDKSIKFSLNAGLDSFAAKTCMAESFWLELGTKLDTEKTEHLDGATGVPLLVLGYTKVSFCFEGSAGTVFHKVGCYVIKDLATALLFGAAHTEFFKLRDAPGVVAPILSRHKSKASKNAIADISQAIGESAKIRESQNFEQRKASRTKLEEVDDDKGSSPSNDSSSPIGGSSTSVASWRSSMDDPSNTNTTTSSSAS